MPVDYSKWDALELSDDSDIEVHPNVDKKSFIRAKQAQIHQERDQRRHQIKTLKYERIINDGLMNRIDRLLTALKSHRDSAGEGSQTADELILQSLVESAGNPEDDAPPDPPEGVHTHIKDKPTYSRMMATMVDQVKKAVDPKEPDNRYEAYITEITDNHRTHIEGLQKQLLEKLDELEKLDKKFITSDSYGTGFDYSSVSQKKDEATDVTAVKKASATPELLNPNALSSSEGDVSSGAEADVDEPKANNEDDDPNATASPTAKKFAKIPTGDYRALHQFIQEHPSLLSEKETDGLLVEAFSSQMDGKARYARQCVHQALLLQYCRQLGRDGVPLFFKRITTSGHQAQKMFVDDVANTYSKIRERGNALAAQRAENPDDADQVGGVERIQLHAVDPGTQINIQIPSTLTDDSTEEQRAARSVFESSPPGLQRSLESGSLDEVNKVLGKMSVEEAEEVVEKLGDSGMLSLEQGVIDTTTEEGRKAMKEIEEEGKLRQQEEDGEVKTKEGLSEDPPLD